MKKEIIEKAMKDGFYFEYGFMEYHAYPETITVDWETETIYVDRLFDNDNGDFEFSFDSYGKLWWVYVGGKRWSLES